MLVSWLLRVYLLYVVIYSALNRVLEPSVLVEMTLSNGKIHTFEVSFSLLVCYSQYTKQNV